MTVPEPDDAPAADPLAAAGAAALAAWGEAVIGEAALAAPAPAPAGIDALGAPGAATRCAASWDCS
ncbi:MAG: hypothetical protein ABSC32_07740 [Steroidobacteraceae bacterium]